MVNRGWRRCTFHNHLEIGYCYEGHGTLVIEEKTRCYGPGTYSVIPHNICHTTVSDDGMLCRCEYLFIDVESFLESSYADNKRFAEHLVRLVNQRPLVGDSRENPKLTQSILALIDEMRQKRPFYLVSARGLLLTLLIELARAVEDDEAAMPEPTSAQNLVILDALNYVTSRYSEGYQGACTRRGLPHERDAFSADISGNHVHRTAGVHQRRAR